MTFDSLVENTRNHVLKPDIYPTVFVPSDWAQGRTVYGGLSAALAYAAMKEKVQTGRLMRSFNCNFVGPLETDEPFTIDIEILREGKNASQALTRIIQKDKVAVLCQASFGISRKSRVSVQNNDTHDMALPKKPKFIPYIPKVTPKFIRQFELAIDKGSMPFSNSKKHVLEGWMRFKKAPIAITDAHLICMIDAWPPTVLQMLRWPAPASSMSWNVEFIHPHSELNSQDWFAYQASTRQAADGYAHTEANIWDQQGELIAISRQAVAVFD